MKPRIDFYRLQRGLTLPIFAAASVLVTIVVVLTASSSRQPAIAALVTSRAQFVSPSVHLSDATPSGGTPPSTAPAHPKAQHQPASSLPGLTLAKQLGQMIIASFAGTVPTRSILADIRAGHVGGIILFGDNTANGVSATHALARQLQDAAVAGGNPRLLIMTDQEGGEVERFPGLPPVLSASQMSDPKVAAMRGAATALLLRAAGVNVDLAPVADVARIDGFMEREQRTFGNTPGTVAAAACAFANALAADGVAYTLKHFPGLGDALTSTDTAPVSVPESAGLLNADAAAYRKCGANARALVMVSSASYEHLTGSTPAVLTPRIYSQVLPSDGVNAVTISDDFQAGAIAGLPAPARTAINAGLDMVMYAQTETASANAYQLLYQDLQQGELSPSRIRGAWAKIKSLKASLNLL